MCSIKNIKCHDQGGKLRLTFDWPIGVGQVYVNGKLYTLQEYKARGGFITEKIRGRTVYYISDSEVEQGRSVCFVEKTFVTCKIREISGLGYDKRYKNHEITLTADYHVPANVICYEKKKNATACDNDDILYYIGDAVSAGQPLKRVIRTMKDEYIHMSIDSEHELLYEVYYHF